MVPASDPVAFEQPLTERVRTFLRLEHLFAQHRHHREDVTPFGVRSTLQSLLDLLVLISRSDLKNEILKELAEQHAHLTRLAAKPGVDQERLQAVLADIGQVTSAMQQLPPHFASSLLRGNDFLTSVLNRSGIPGGTCAFDLPHYHYWLSQPFEAARRNLDAWFGDLRPFEQAANLYLKLLRGSVEPRAEIARGGMFVHAPQGSCTLVRVLVPVEAGVYPEISAGKHRFTVRFMSAREVNTRTHQATGDVAFLMQCCGL